MRVLIVFRDEISDNLFVSTLCKGIKEEGINISHSLNRFWNDDSFFDIIHFQWPEELAGWTIQDVNIIEKLKKRLAFFKHRGTKIVYTRHNLHPHYNSPVLSDVYDIIERSADLIVHMGEFSKNQYESENPHSDNVVIPHHIYENTYNESLSKKEARKKLGIPDDKFVITAFGKFRNKEEIDMTVSAFRKLKIKNKYLLAPRLFPFSKKPLKDSLLKRLASKVGYYLIIPFFRFYNI